MSQLLSKFQMGNGSNRKRLGKILRSKMDCLLEEGMISMKRLACLLFSFIMVLALAPSTFAASTEAVEAANALHERGIFNGTGTNRDGTPIFDLDKVPTRNQAIIMLIRLLGKEDEAFAGTWNIPFTDVSENMRPYVGYAYANKLTSGTSATTYSGNRPVSANQYIAFVLRSLGYVSGTDFTVSSATTLSNQLGLTDGQYDNASSFTRGDVAIISYRSLNIPAKGQSTTTPAGSESNNVYALYARLAAMDFQSIRSKYTSAEPLFAYVIVYTNKNGEQCVLTDVWYKLLSTYNDVTLHNLTTNQMIRDPVRSYDSLIERQYGANRMKYMDLKLEILEHLAAEQTDGIYISAEALLQ